MGIPGLNLDDTTYSGLPAGFVEGFGADSNSPPFNFGSGLGVNRCNCPLDQDEKQFQWVGNILKMMGNHQVKFGADSGAPTTCGCRRIGTVRVSSPSVRT